MTQANQKAEQPLFGREAYLQGFAEGFRLIFEGNPHPMWVFDRETLAFLDVNEATIRHYGYSREEFLSMTVKDVRPAEDVSAVAEVASQPFSGVDQTGLWRHLKKDGTLIWVEIARHAIFFEGKPAKLVLAYDVTEREQLKQTLEARSRQRAVVAELGHLALVDTCIYRLMDEAVERVSQVLGMEYCKVLELLPQGDQLLLRAGVGWNEGLVGRATVGAGTDSQAGYTLLFKEPVVVEDLRAESRFSGPPLLHDHGVVSGMSVTIEGPKGGQPFGVLGVHTRRHRTFSRDDINFLRMVANILAAAVEREQAEREVHNLNERLEEKVRQRTAQLEAANRDLDAFTQMVSHDLRNRLSPILGSSELLLDSYGEELDEIGQRFLGHMASASRRMNRLVIDLLKFSKARDGGIHRERVDLSVLARGTAEELEATQPEREVELIIEEGLVVEGDDGLLRVVLENILGNAWKFTENQPGAKIEFGVVQRGETLTYYVRDNGVGFDPECSEELFEPFGRHHRECDFKGTGIGLATVRRIIERHGGRIWAEGAVDKGATFYFTLGPSS